MGRYSVSIKPSAVKEIEAIPTKKDRRQIVQKIRRLADDPRPPGCQKLSGRDRYRLRHGRYRIIYAVHDQELVVYVVKVGARKDVYRRTR